MTTAAAPYDVPQKEALEARIAVATGVKIWRGAAVGIVLGAGYATPLVVATAGMQFIGVAEENCDNTNGTQGTTTGLWMRVARSGGFAFQYTGTITQANVGQNAYFNDDSTVTLTPTAIKAGTIYTVDQANGLVWVDIENAVKTQGTLDSAKITAVPLALVNTNGTGGTAQVIAQLPIPANTITAIGTRIKFRAGVSSTVHPGSETFAATVTIGSATGANGSNISGGTTICTAPATTNTVGNMFYLEGELVFVAIGSSGSWCAVGLTSAGTQAANAPHCFSNPVGAASPSAVACNTTLLQNLTIAGNFSTSADTSAVALMDFSYDIVRP